MKVEQPGPDTFLQLTDTPDTYSGSGSKAVTVTAGATGLEFTIGGVGAGDVVGPASSVNNRVVFFDGVTGKLIKDSGLTLSGSNTGDQTSIAGITGTIAQFNTALSDGDFATGGGTATGTNTGDNAVNTLYSGLVSNATHTGDATGATALTVVRINGVSMAGLATGILKNTTTTGVPSIAVNSDLPAMSATVGGAVPTPPNNTTTFLRGDGTFAAPPGGSTDYSLWVLQGSFY